MTYRRLDYLTLNWPILALQASSQAALLASRLLVLFFCAPLLKPWIFILIGLHWLLMSIWLSMRKVDCVSGWWEERVLNILAAILYLFIYVEMKETRSGIWVWLVFQLVYILENGALVVVWSMCTNHYHLIPVIASSVAATFIIGILLMLVYYKYFNPIKAFSLEKKARPKVLLDEDLVTCTDNKHFPNSKHCPMLAQLTPPLAPTAVNKPRRPQFLPFFVSKNSPDSPEPRPGENTPETAPVDYFRTRTKEIAKVKEIPKLPSPPSFTKNNRSRILDPER